MDHIPETPDELLEQLGDLPLSELFPNLEELPLRTRKLLRVIHQELSSGDLSDQSFMEMTILMVVIWKSFNGSALAHNTAQIEAQDELDDYWFDAQSHLTRMDQYLRGVLAALELNPEPPCSDGGNPPFSQYVIHTDRE